MHLYITLGEINFHIPDIILKDGWCPTVCGFQLPEGRIESAIWFKVMITDAVCVDCSNQRLSWIPVVLDYGEFNAQDSGIASCSVDHFNEFQSSMCVESSLNYVDDCVLSAIENMFTSVAKLASQYHGNEMPREDFFKEIIQQLHINILPNLQLKSRDISCLEAFIQRQKVFIDQVDQEIIKKTDERNAVKQSQTKLRGQFVSEILQSRKKGSPIFSKQMVAQLILDLEKDIKDLSLNCTNEENPQAEISRLRSAISRLKDVGKGGTLTRIFHGLTADTAEPIHNIYMEMSSSLDAKTQEIMFLADRKLLILSVKEAAYSAVTDLISGVDTFGIDVDPISSTRSTDVLGGATLLSTGEQISNILADKSNRLSQMHREFCSKLVRFCNSTIRDKQLLDMIRRESSQSQDSNTSYDLDFVVGSASSDRSSCISDVSYCSSSVQYDMQKSSERTVSFSHSLPAITGTSPSHDNNAARSVSEYLPNDPNDEQNDLKKARSAKHLKTPSSLPTRPTFKSYLPELISLSENGEDSPVYVFDINRIQATMESVKVDILNHLKTMTVEFQNCLSLDLSDIVYREIWINYEGHLYSEIMNPLVQVYELQYSNVTKALCESLNALSPADLELDDAFLVHLLQNESSSTLDVSLPDSPFSAFVVKSSSADVGTSMDESSREDTLKSRPRLLTDEDRQSDSSDDSLSTLRRCLSDKCETRLLRTVRRSMQVRDFGHPAVLIYERKLKPDVDKISSRVDEGIQRQSVVESMKMKPRYLNMFQSSLSCIDAAISAKTPALKLRQLTRCLRETTVHIGKFYQDIGAPASESGCDELMDAIVILLCNMEPSKLALLYCQVKILADVMPDWLSKGPLCFTLMQFIGACQFIQDKLLCKRNRLEPLCCNRYESQV